MVVGIYPYLRGLEPRGCIVKFQRQYSQRPHGIGIYVLACSVRRKQ